MQSLKELIEGAFFHSWQRTAMVLGGIVVALALPVTIILTQQQQDLRQRASEYCTMKLVGTSYLCVSNYGGGTGVYGLPPGTSTTVNGTTYYGNPEGGAALLEKPEEQTPITYEIPGDTPSTSKVGSAGLNAPCNQKCSVEGEKAASSDPNFYYICTSGCFDTPVKCETGTTFDKVKLECLDPNRSELARLIDDNGRSGIRTWAASRSIAEINASVASLNQNYRNKLATVILDTKAGGTDKTNLITAMQKILNNKSTGFYVEIWSYSLIEMPRGGGGGEATCGLIRLFTQGESSDSMLDVLLHESLHSFNCMNGGPIGALDEGSAIWIFKTAFPGSRSVGELQGGLAETTYGTANYYRDYGVNESNYSPINAATGTTSKSKELFSWLSSTDPSKLPWDNQAKLQACYDLYYKGLNRKSSNWFDLAAAASQKIATDPNCTGTTGTLTSNNEALRVSIVNSCNGGSCCTENEKLLGTICSIPQGSSGCNCPNGWNCNYIGAQSSDGSQKIQCSPPTLKQGIPIGGSCSPAGAQCAEGDNFYGDCIWGNGGYTCVPTYFTPTPTTSPCAPSSNKPLDCSCDNSSQCSSGYCGDGGGEQVNKKCAVAPTATKTPTPTPTGTQTGFNFNNGLDHCRPSNKNCESFETLISGGCNILPSGKICRLNSPFPDSVPTDSYCSTISSDGYIRHCLPSTVSAPSGWAVQSNAANSACTTYNGVSSKCYKTTNRVYPTVTENPDPTPSLTQTPTDETHIALDISLPGVGTNIITQGPGSTSNNPTPLRVTREVEVLLGNAEGANVTSLASGSLTPVSGTLTFSPTTFTYKGEINLGNLPTGNYQVFVRFDNTLYKQAPGFPLLTLGQTTAIPSLKPNAGDIDRREGSDDELTLDDYNLFMACYKEKEICTPQAKIRADLDDNGILDIIDLNLMQRGFLNVKGDSPLN